MEGFACLKVAKKLSLVNSGIKHHSKSELGNLEVKKNVLVLVWCALIVWKQK